MFTESSRNQLVLLISYQVFILHPFTQQTFLSGTQITRVEETSRQLRSTNELAKEIIAYHFELRNNAYHFLNYKITVNYF